MDEEQRDLDLAWDYLTRPGSTFAALLAQCLLAAELRLDALEGP